jgi:hypothetical protein
VVRFRDRVEDDERAAGEAGRRRSAKKIFESSAR